MRRDVFGLIQIAERYLTKNGCDGARLQGEALMLYVLGKQDRAFLVSAEHEVLSRKKRQLFFSLVRIRGTGYPLQYIVGEVGFLDLTLRVREGVLIPRPETELLVLTVLELYNKKEALHVLDLGTGSGNIACAIAYLCPQAQIVAVDISPEAIAVARENAERLGLAKQIDFRCGDLFSPIRTTEHFHIILSNPPYIAANEFASLPREILHEPQCALDGGEDGLRVYRQITKQVHQYLKPEGMLAFEIGAGQAKQIQELLREAGFLHSEVFPDYANIDRVVIAQ